MSDRDEFLKKVRNALGRRRQAPEAPDGKGTAFFDSPETVVSRAAEVERRAQENAGPMMEALRESGRTAGWKVAGVATPAEAGEYVRSLAIEQEARSLVHSAHPVVPLLGLGTALSGLGIGMSVMAVDEEDPAPAAEQRLRFRERGTEADIGVTGVDYVIADTGTCVLLPRRGVSRLVSLLPPVYIAVVTAGQIVPDLDSLMALIRRSSQAGEMGSYMSLVTGPSRSADIEYTIVTGVHGPGEAHMVLVGQRTWG